MAATKAVINKKNTHTKAKVPVGDRDDRNPKNTLQVWNLPPGLRRDFKAACAKRDTSIHDAVVELLRTYVNQS